MTPLIRAALLLDITRICIYSINSIVRSVKRNSITG